MSLNLKHLAAFAAVARLRSFTAAARQLHISQPALTVHIRQLEETLGVLLLQRTTRSVRLTPAGAALAPSVDDLIAGLDSAIAAARALVQPTRESVRIAALPSVAATLLPRIIATFRKRNATTSITILDVAAGAVAGLVRSGEADLGLGIQHTPATGLDFTSLFQDRLCLVLPAGSPLLRKRRIALEELRGVPLILPGPGSSVRLLVERAFAEAGLTVEPAGEASLMATIAGMVRAGLGAAILPSASFDMGELSGLRLRHLHAPALAREIGVLCRSGHPLTPVAARFVTEILHSPAVAALRRSNS